MPRVVFHSVHDVDKHIVSYMGIVRFHLQVGVVSIFQKVNYLDLLRTHVHLVLALIKVNITKSNRVGQETGEANRKDRWFYLQFFKIKV